MADEEKKKTKAQQITDAGQAELRRQRMRTLARTLIKKRDEAVVFRAGTGVERRWKEDETAFNGDLDDGNKVSMIDYATGEAPPRGGDGSPVRSKAKVNVIRGKCETAEGRFVEILFPAGERNWSLSETPVPDLVKAMSDERQVTNTATGEKMVDQEGAPVTAADIAAVKVDEAKERMEAMETEIQDQLIECDYAGECFKVIRDAVRTGTGVLKGPSVRKAVRRSYVKNEEGTWEMQTLEDHTPTSQHVDYQKIFPAPDCGEDIKRAPYIWEGGEILPRELRSLIGVEGYDSEQIEAVLNEPPQRTTVGESAYSNKLEIKKDDAEFGAAYEYWEYHGDVNKEELRLLGLDVEDVKGTNLTACVVFANERPIKTIISVVDTGDLIYDFFQWTQMKGSPWGIGVARQGIWWQRIIQAAWRTMLDNARDSSGGQVIVGPGVNPMDNRWELTGKKIWRYSSTDANADVRKVFDQVQLDNNQQDLQAIIDLAMKFLEVETSLPLLFQGEQPESVPDVLGIVEVMVDSSNIGLRSRVRQWDQYITKPHITRYYYWNMEYALDEDIKGDYNVMPIGSSVLLARDKQVRALLQLFNLREDEKAGDVYDWEKAYEELAKHLNADILKSDPDKRRDQKEKENAPQQAGDPRIMTAQIRSEGEMAKAQLNQQADMAELEFKAEEAEIQRMHELELARMEYDMKLMEYAEKHNLELSKVKATLAIEASKQNLMRELEDKKAKTAELTTPPVEPTGKAKEGQAYQA